MTDNLTPPKDIKRLVIHFNGSDNNQDYGPPTKKLLHAGNIKEDSNIHGCKECSYRTMVKPLLERHMKIHIREKSKPKPYTDSDTRSTLPKDYVQCPKCTYFTKKESSLKVHMRIHFKGTPYKCTECEFFGKDLPELIQHYKDTRDLICDICNYATHVRTEMELHERRHNGDKIFLCAICDYSSTDRSNLHRHLKIHMPSS